MLRSALHLPRGYFSPSRFSFVQCSRLSSDSNANPFSHQNSDSQDQSAQSDKNENPKTRIRDFNEEKCRVLKASLPHVFRLGWSEASMMSGARDIGLSPTIVGSFPRKEAALVEYFMDFCLQQLVDKIDAEEELNNLILSERLAKLIQMRLQMQVPYISTWPQALSIQAQPLNIPTSFKQRAALIDEIWQASGDQSDDIDWYVKRTVLGGIYSTSEVYMLTDKSSDFSDTWSFLHRRIRDAFDLQNSVQEVSYLAEAVGAGVESSLKGFVNRVSGFMQKGN